MLTIFFNRTKPDIFGPPLGRAGGRLFRRPVVATSFFGVPFRAILCHFPCARAISAPLPTPRYRAAAASQRQQRAGSQFGFSRNTTLSGVPRKAPTRPVC